MRTILFCGYRDWAIEIYESLSGYQDQTRVVLIEDRRQFLEALDEVEPDVIFFIGWSWIVRKEIVDAYYCICLHPSPLPKYRGGSPVQHQILNGEKDSAVTLFKMDEHIDRGDVLFQQSISLDGNLPTIFKRIVDVGTVGVCSIVEKFLAGEELAGIPQDHKEATYFPRRTPDMSEITIDDLKTQSAKQVYDKVRALQHPYPNAFITCADGKRLLIQVASLETD